MAELNNNGIIIKGIGGFYYVKTADSVLECKAKGIFRKRGITPLAGDHVEVIGEEGGYAISEIHERKNFFQRPPIANVDEFFYVVSSVEPRPNYMVADRLIMLCEQRGITPVILITKTDLAEAKEFIDLYRSVGYTVIDVMADEKAALEQVEAMIEGNLCVFSGNSGVGKSTFLNKLHPGLGLNTAEISKKLGRGKHTTRAVELYELYGGYVADTPGFSALDFERAEKVPKEDIAKYFIEFRPYLDDCFFTGCSHRTEKGCAVLEAKEKGLISAQRHEDYCYLYDEAKNRPEY
ncbi:MAG: ribosome small subunit-dependent GTPase A [Oscillospiraceae bacterium]|nr:ribosome small subunit-dependent GTPase A [Oscillospiraceae bacterium]MBR0451865.1 ribosome small subunit-dependent GTPase A [Oscillospiraceae bacterium]